MTYSETVVFRLLCYVAVAHISVSYSRMFVQWRR